MGRENLLSPMACLVWTVIGPLEDLADISANHNAWLMVDDAHGFGVLGANGGGLVEHLNLSLDRSQF